MRRILCGVLKIKDKMRLTKLTLTRTCVCLLLYVSLHPSAASQFSSHVTINTPGSNVHHGVGNPIATASRRYYRKPQLSFGNMRQPHKSGYPRVKPSIPFLHEDIAHGNSLGATPWQYNNYIGEDPIPVLPPSPYKVDSPDPESLWPEGLFLPPYSQTYFRPKIERISGNDIGQVLSDTPMDPYLLEGAEAIAAVRRANDHGELFFHDIPHINSLQANQQLRVENGLEKLRLGSLRSQWHNFYRH